ncbi:MAG TPA: DUF503 domain-containing protein [bacterium]|nr:DUF503 domain-containing protein [bacterium]
MHIGLLQVHVYIPTSESLKDKRQVLRSIKQRLRNSFNVSVAETGQQDLWQRSDLALVMVATDKAHIQETFSNAVRLILNKENVEILEESVEFL